MSRRKRSRRGGSQTHPAAEPASQVRIVSAALDPDEKSWRRLGASRADLPAYTHDRMQALAYQLWLTSLWGNRLIEVVTDHVVGEGVSLASKDKAALGAAREFWEHPVNRLHLRFEELVTSLGLYGELLIPASVSKFEGRVYLGFISPRLIRRVVCDPDNCTTPIGVVLRGEAAAEERRLRVILGGDPREYLGAAAQREREKMRDGEAFLYQINKAPDAERGVSDIFRAIDWVDVHERFIFDAAERSRIQNSFIYDVTLKGAGPEAVAAWLAANGATPRPGSVRVHNEKEEWQQVSPVHATQGTGVGELADQIKKHFVSGTGLPLHFAGLLDDVNRATGESEALPGIKRMMRRQRYVRSMALDLINYQLGQAHRAGRISAESLGAGSEPSFPEMSKKDLTRIGATILQISQALTLAVNGGWISEETAAEVFARLVGELDVEIDAEAENEKVKGREREDAQAQAGAHLEKVRPLRRTAHA